MVVNLNKSNSVIKFFNIEDTFWDGGNTIYFPLVIDPKRAKSLGVKFFNLTFRPVVFDDTNKKPYYISSNANKKSYLKENINFPNIDNSLINNFYSKNITLSSNQNNVVYNDQTFAYDLNTSRQEIILQRNITMLRGKLGEDQNKKFYVTIFALDKNKKIIETTGQIESNGNFIDYIEDDDIDLERSIGANFSAYVNSTNLTISTNTDDQQIRLKISGDTSFGNRLYSSLVNSGFISQPLSVLGQIIENDQLRYDFLNVRIQGIDSFSLNYSPRGASSTDYVLSNDEIQQLAGLLSTSNRITIQYAVFVKKQDESKGTSYTEFKDQELSQETVQEIVRTFQKNQLSNNILEGNILNFSAFLSRIDNTFVNRLNISLSPNFQNYISLQNLLNKKINYITLVSVAGRNLQDTTVFNYSDSFLENNTVFISETKLIDIMSSLSSIDLYIRSNENISKIIISLDNIPIEIQVSNEERVLSSRFNESELQITESDSENTEDNIRNIVKNSIENIMSNISVKINYDPVSNKYIEMLEIDSSGFLENPYFKKLGYFEDISTRSDEALMIDFLNSIYISVSKTMEFYIGENQNPVNSVRNFIVYDNLNCVRDEERQNIYKHNLSKESQLGYALNDTLDLFVNIPGNSRNIDNMLASFIDDNNEVITKIKRKLEIKILTFTKQINRAFENQESIDKKEASNSLTKLITQTFPSYPRKKYIDFVKRYVINQTTTQDIEINNKKFKREMFELFERLSPSFTTSIIETIEDNTSEEEINILPGIAYETYRNSITDYNRKSMKALDNLNFSILKSNQELNERSKIHINRKASYQNYDYLIDLRDNENRLLDEFIQVDDIINAEIQFNYNFLNISSISSENQENSILDLITSNINVTTINYQNIIKNVIAVRDGNLIKIKIVDVEKPVTYVDNDFYNQAYSLYGSPNFKLNTQQDTGLLLKNIVGKLSLIINNRVFENTRVIEPNLYSFELIQEKYRNIRSTFSFFNNQNLNYDKLFLNINSNDKDFYRPLLKYKKSRT